MLCYFQHFSVLFFILSLPHISTRTHTPFPSTSLFRSPSPTTPHRTTNPGPTMPIDWPVLLAALLSGLTGGLHCAAMCGGIATSFPAMGPRGDLRYVIEPNLGRVLGYVRSEEHTSELQSLMRNSSAVFCLKNKIYH